MFTGIINLSARLLAADATPTGRRLVIATGSSAWPDAALGQSIAVNGCCLTIASLNPDQIAFDVIPETLAKTNLGLLKPGDKVHLERALRIGDRLDGHFVQGHVDGTAELVGIHRDADAAQANDFRLEIRPPAVLMKYLTPHGSIALDGVSLTIARLHEHTFEVALIPTTLHLTALGNHSPGWPYNLEADTLAKTVVYWMENWKETSGK